jgi:hypothetical protein
MYTYIMERTQIYLTKDQAVALDREAHRRGTTRSHLIREAIAERYGPKKKDPEEIIRVLEETAGLWKDRTETGAEYIDRMRSGRRLRELYPPEEESADR